MDPIALPLTKKAGIRTRRPFIQMQYAVARTEPFKLTPMGQAKRQFKRLGASFRSDRRLRKGSLGLATLRNCTGLQISCENYTCLYTAHAEYMNYAEPFDVDLLAKPFAASFAGVGVCSCER